MTTERAIYLGLLASQCDERLQIELERCQANAANELELIRKTKAIDTQLQRETILLLRAELEKSRAWYREPEFVAVISAVVTTAVLFGARSLIVK